MNLPHYTERKQPFLGEYRWGPISQHRVRADLRCCEKKFRSFFCETNIKIVKRMMQNTEFLSIICFRVSMRQRSRNFGQMTGCVARGRLSVEPIAKFSQEILQNCIETIVYVHIRASKVFRVKLKSNLSPLKLLLLPKNGTKRNISVYVSLKFL